MTEPLDDARGRAERAALQDESPLQRWSRHKRQATTGPVPAAPQSPDPKGEAARAEPATCLTDANMPPIESLDADSDYSVFMSPKVSTELRRLALRKLFRLPQYGVRCELNEYEGNFNDFKPLGDTVTHEMQAMLKREALNAAAVNGGSGSAEQGGPPPAGPGDPRQSPSSAAQPAPVAQFGPATDAEVGPPLPGATE